MKSSPYNACDYRCERCLETDNCKVYQMLQEKSEHHQNMGRDENEMGAALEDVKETFQEAIEILRERAEGLGLNLDEFSDIADDTPYLENDPLYESAHDFTMQAHAFIITADALVNENDREWFEDVVWHHTVVSAKTYRALSSENDLREDAVNSAAVAVKSLTICTMAFDHLSTGYPDMAVKCKRLSDMAIVLKEKLKTRFLINREPG